MKGTLSWLILTAAGLVGQPPAAGDAPDLQQAVAKAEAPPEVPAPPLVAASAKPAKHEAIFGLISDSHEEYKAKMESLAKQLVKADAAVGAEANTDLGSFLLAGIFWGAVSLITPCV